MSELAGEAAEGQGVEDLGEVKAAYLEGDGQISVSADRRTRGREVLAGIRSLNTPVGAVVS